MNIPPLTRSVGSAERSMRALLERELLRSQLSFQEWTTLVFTNVSPLTPEEVAQRQVAGHVVANEHEAEQAIAKLIDVGLLCGGKGQKLEHTDKGQSLFATLSESVEEITQSLYGDLPSSDLEITHRTLSEIASRASKLLVAA